MIKYLYPISLLALIVIGLSACGKNDNQNVGVTGKWQLLSDSSSLAGGGPFKGGGSKYIGEAADTYEFTANGRLVAHVKSLVDSATYNFRGDGKVVIDYSVVHAGSATIRGSETIYDVTRPDSHTAILSAGGLTPEGWYARIITLKK